MTNFNYTEEAFLLSSFQEVTKIWAKGTGEASFNLNILDGVADLQLHFKLGSPRDPHCVPADPPDPGQSFPQDDQEPPRHRHQKGRRRRDRDRLRAQEHQAKQAPTEAAVPAVKLPFTGRILQVKIGKTEPKRKSSPERAPAADASAAVPNKTVAPTVTPKAVGQHPLTLPGKFDKNSKLTPQHYIDVSVAKKQLFVPDRRSSPLSNEISMKKSYKMKENDLWTKLFT